MRLHRAKRVTILATLCLACAGFADAQQVPATRAKTIAGTEVTLPQAGSTRPLVLAIGFSHRGGNEVQAWDKRLAPLYLQDPRMDYYQVADFQGVPSLIMKMILHGMRREVPSNEHARFILLDSHEDEWKRLVNFTSSGDAYLVVADPSGRVTWQTRGAITDAQLAALQAAVSNLLSAPRQTDR
jgi:hypothetical protein